MSVPQPISYRICTRCVMDSSDAHISFDKNGYCNHCREYELKIGQELPDPPTAASLLQNLVRKIKEDGRGKAYDCVIGLSGGVDSSYVALQVKRLGLRPIGIHLDNGWNSELAVQNVENTVRKLKIDLITKVLDWSEFSDLQRSFFYASVPNCEAPTDHAIVASLFQCAAKFRIRYIISGSNLTTEGMHLPPEWGHDSKDWRNIRDIQRKHGKLTLKSFPHLTFPGFCWRLFVNRIRFTPLLNYLAYHKQEAIYTIQQELGWKNYGRKHGESIFTRFYQEYYLPKKFGFDKRRLHLSTLILSGQVLRADALTQLAQPLFSADELREYETLFLKKLKFTPEAWSQILQAKPQAHTAYRHNCMLSKRDSALYRLGRRIATSRRHLPSKGAMS